MATALVNGECQNLRSGTNRRRRLGAAVWALTVWATGHLGDGTRGRRRFGAGRLGDRRYCEVVLAGDCCPNAS